jgi:hypothetical protein
MGHSGFNRASYFVGATLVVAPINRIFEGLAQQGTSRLSETFLYLRDDAVEHMRFTFGYRGP